MIGPPMATALDMDGPWWDLIQTQQFEMSPEASCPQAPPADRCREDSPAGPVRWIDPQRLRSAHVWDYGGTSRAEQPAEGAGPE